MSQSLGPASSSEEYKKSERWQEEGVATVLPAENAEQEAVPHKQDAAPCYDGDLLRVRVGNPGGLDGEVDSRQRQESV